MTFKFINKFYGGNVRDEKSKIIGAALNVEEIDILENQDYIRPAQIMSTDALPSATEAYAYTADNSDTVFGYGKDTGTGRIRIVKVTTGGADNPGAFATVFTSADATNLPTVASPIAYHKTTEANPNYLYFLTLATNTVKLSRFEISAGSDFSVVGTLTGLDNSNDRYGMRRIYGELMIMNGNYIARVDKDGSFTDQAFRLPWGWEAVDICEAGNSAIILARSVVANSNITKGFFWDLSSATQFDDSFDIPFGGPQWIQKHREIVRIMCAANGKARIYQLTGAYAGAVPQQITNIEFSSIGTETQATPISSSKMVAIKDDIMYFGLYKTDKSGIYALGQIDNSKQVALYMAKRFDTSDYSTHTPRAVFIQGPNFYASFRAGSTETTTRCESNNSPTRSSNAIYETVWIDDERPFSNKAIPQLFVSAQPLPASTAISIATATDYSASYTTATRADGTAMNTAGATIGVFDSRIAGVKTFRFKILFTSSGTSTPKLTSLGWISNIETAPSFK